jgi:hypothetical protein
VGENGIGEDRLELDSQIRNRQAGNAQVVE